MFGRGGLSDEPPGEPRGAVRQGGPPRETRFSQLASTRNLRENVGGQKPTVVKFQPEHQVEESPN